MSETTPQSWDWSEAGQRNVPRFGQVHVWLVCLNDERFDQKTCLGVLPEREQKRARKFTHPGAREEYVVSRALLRVLIGGYLDTDPLALKFGSGERGKPFLREIPGRSVPQFNMTHANGVALYAFSMDQAVGVDIERVDRKTRVERVSKRYFTERESDAITNLNPECRKEAFIRTWTCKEACLKWTGQGLAGGLKTHEIVFSDAWSAPMAFGNGPQPSLTMLDPGAGWIGALAVARPDPEVVCGVWSGSTNGVGALFT